MAEVWDQTRIAQYITQGIEESLTLDYKAAAIQDFQTFLALYPDAPEAEEVQGIMAELGNQG